MPSLVLCVARCARCAKRVYQLQAPCLDAASSVCPPASAMTEQPSSKRRKAEPVEPSLSLQPQTVHGTSVRPLSSDAASDVEDSARASLAASVPGRASDSAQSATARRLFSNVQIQVTLCVQAGGTVLCQLHARRSSKAERRVERRDRKFELQHANRQQRRLEHKQRRREQRRQQQQKDAHTQSAPSVPAVRRGKEFREWVRSRQSCSPSVWLDCQWEAAMVETEVQSLSKQIKFLYADNMHAQHPMRIALTSYGYGSAEDETGDVAGQSQAAGVSVGADLAASEVHAPRLYKYMARIEGFERWLMYRYSLHYRDVFAARSSAASSTHSATPASLVYLTAESPNLLTRLQSDAVYVIGALVDHNRLPGMCHSVAALAGVATARLPILECMRVEQGSRRTVITVNQVFDCLLSWWNANMEQSGRSESSAEQQQCSDVEPWQLRWAAAFHAALPKRGGWQVREEWSAAISHTDTQLGHNQSTLSTL